MLRLRPYLPDWMQDWLDIIVPGVQIVLIVLVAILLQRMLHRLLQRAGRHYQWPIEFMVPIGALVRWIIMGGAALLVLERLGVSATVLWTAFTGFAAVGAVAFFAAWSVLSNLFCALLIFTVEPFRLGDYIEVLDTAEKPGAKGRVVDINLLYTTLEDFLGDSDAPVLLQIPNALIFQRVVRRWTTAPSRPAAAVAHAGDATPSATAEAGASSPAPAGP
ncbi:mechanosensitive ion channel family protein [Acidovorax sp. NCPPB 2350]|nr:mechanosensitive ion channel family protein [Acidovorax sp. NCPPB 2350]